MSTSKPKATVITFPGSNCDDDCVYVLEKLCGFSVDRLWHKDSVDLSAYQLVVLPGGFSYGDYLRCGAIAALSPIMESVKAYAQKGGLVVGICNGFQLLCEAGLLPGALAKNASLNFICRDVDIAVKNTKTPWTCVLKDGEKIRIPIAHGDGRYVIGEEECSEMEKAGQVVFTYEENPNGSWKAIAGVTNKEGNVLGLMPHPERASDLRGGEGLKVFQSIQRWISGARA